MSATSELSFEGVETTVEPPVCPVCSGSGIEYTGNPEDERGCLACGGSTYKAGCGYERGENASLLASVPDEDWSAFYRQAAYESGVVRGSRYQQVSEDVAEVVGR